MLILNFFQVLQSLVREKKNWYLDELVSAMEGSTGKHVSTATLWRSLKFCGITRKKVGLFVLRIFVVL